MLKEHSKFWIFYTTISLLTMISLIVPIIDPRYVLVGSVAILLIGRELLFRHMYEVYGDRKKYEAALAAEEQSLGKPLSYFISIGSVVAIVIILRAFIAEPYQVPTGSMLPTIQLGDYIIVSKSTYGLRIPMTSTFLWTYNTPQRGEIVIFEHPNPQNPDDEGITLIKRVVAVAGDVVSIDGGVLQINGKAIEQSKGRAADEIFGNFTTGGSLSRHEEDLFGLKHPVLYDNGHGVGPLSESTEHWERYGKTREQGCSWPPQFCTDDAGKGKPFTIPDGYVFVMGDNRDNSADSRVWGPLPVDHIRGKALFVGYAKNVEGWFRLLK